MLRTSPLGFVLLTLTLTLTLTLALLLSPLARANETAPGAVPSALSLQQAVRVTLERSPQILVARQDVALRDGALRETSGLFDSVFRVTPSIEHVEGKLSPQSRAQEEKRRILLRELAKAFGQLKDELAAAIARGDTRLPPCPTDLDTLRVRFDGDEQFGQPLCEPIRGDVFGRPDDDDTEGLIDFANSVFVASPTTPGDLATFRRQLSEVLGLEIDDLSEDLRQRGQELLELSHRIAREGETRARLALERLGVFPEREFRRTAALSLEWTRPLRSGALFQFEAQFAGVEDNYRGKPLDPDFGGSGAQNTFRSGFSLTFHQPLRKGRGRVSAAAPERAAARNFEAARAQYKHTVSERVLAAILAYLDLAATEESLALLEESLAVQRSIVDSTRQLVSARETARADLTRARARLSEVESGVESGRLSLLSARNVLARTIGLTAEEVRDGPQAVDGLPTRLIEVDVRGLAPRAAGRRDDVRAAESLREASHILFEAARADLRNRLDLSVKLGVNSDYFGPFFRVLRDEFPPQRFPREPLENPTDYFHPTGVWRSLSDRWQPAFAVQLTYEMPFGNNRARGRLTQARSAMRRSAILVTDLARVVGERVVELGVSVRRAEAEAGRRIEAVRRHEASWKASREMHKAGELDLIDTLLTEQNLTQARLQRALALRDHAASVARFRFESGHLVRFSDLEPLEADLAGLVSEQDPL